MRLHTRQAGAALALVFLPAIALSTAPAHAADICKDHQMLSKPRPEASCPSITQQVIVSPDKALHALVIPADISLYASPDMESRVVIRAAAGDTVTSRDHSSPRGTNGYYVDHAQWSPDSQFFVYSL